MSYSLENLWSATDEQIKQILQYFNQQILNSAFDRLNAVILSFNNNLLIPEDRPYVSNSEFNKLFMATDEQLQILSQERGLTDQRSHIGLIKFLIDNINTPVISVVKSIPQSLEPLSLYQMGNSLYLCGTKTFNIREQLKALGGIWNANVKCWSFPLNLRNELSDLIISTVPKIPTTIPEITQVPINIPNNLQIYQMSGQVLLCGKQTYNIQDKLRKLNGGFNKDVGCWVFAPQEAESVLNIYNETVKQNYLEAQRINQQRQLTKQQNIDKAQKILQEDAARKIRLQTPEPEAPYIPNIDRLPREIIEESFQDKPYLTNEYYNLKYQMQLKDIDELEPVWNDKIQILESINVGSTRGSDYIVTYNGDIKPPDLALIYKVNGWKPPDLDGYVRRIDYKKYNVYISGTD